MKNSNFSAKNFKRLVAIFAPNSTRAKKYFNETREILRNFSAQNSADFREIALENLPYFAARETVFRQISAGDLVVACGGDGTAQVVFDAVFWCKNSEKIDKNDEKTARENEIFFATIPLGNGNDFARALNKNRKNPAKILAQNPREFHPIIVEFFAENFEQKLKKNVDNFDEKNLEISENFSQKIAKNFEISNQKIALGSYLTIGAMNFLVDFLNENSARKKRKIFKNFSPVFAFPPAKIAELSREIDALNLTDFRRENRKFDEDSFGFFNVSAAKNLLKIPPKTAFSDADFFFHFAKMRGRNLLGKMLAAGKWSAKFPGEISDFEEIIFAREVENLAVNLAGDSVNFAKVKKIRAEKTENFARVLAK